MDNNFKGDTKKKKDKHPTKRSSSGRKITRPQKIITTSDEEPSTKKSKITITSKERLQILKNKLKDIKNHRLEILNKDSNNKIGTTCKPVNDSSSSLVIINPKLSKPGTSTSTGSTVETLKTSLVTNPASDRIISEKSVSKTKNPEKSASVVRQSSKFLPVFEINDPLAPVGGEVIFDPLEESFTKFDNSFRPSLVEVFNNLQAQNKTIIDQNTTIIEQQKDILLHFSEAKNAEKKDLFQNLYRPPDGCPLQNLEDFIKFESEDNECREKLYKYLKSLGGVSLRHFLSSALKACVVDKLVCEFTWNGSENSIEFGNTKLANILYLSAKQTPNFDSPKDRNIFKSNMLEVLRHTKHLLKKSTKDKIAQDEESIRREISELEAFEKQNEETISSEIDEVDSSNSEEELADDES